MNRHTRRHTVLKLRIGIGCVPFKVSNTLRFNIYISYKLQSAPTIAQHGYRACFLDLSSDHQRLEAAHPIIRREQA